MSSFGLILKSAHHTGRNPVTVGCLNYIAGAVFASLILLYDPGWRLEGVTVLIGAATGVFYVVSFWFLVQAIIQAGVAVTMAIVRLSVLAPILCSIFIWDEVPSFGQTVGILFVCIALPFLSTGVNQTGALSFGRAGWLIGALLLTTGFCSLSPKLFSEMASQGQTPLYLFSLFGVAAVMSLVYLRIRRIAVYRREYGHGILQGLCNTLGASSMVLTLKYLPGTVVFPITSASGLVLTTAAATLIWKERIRPPAYVGIGLTLIALILVNGV
jgi:drug/metabolite transporter (DMT)-like permease